MSARSPLRLGRPATSGMSALVVAAALVAFLGAAGPGRAAEIVVEEQQATKGRPAVLLAPRDASVGTLHVRVHVGAFDDDQMYGRTRLTQRALIDANDALGPDFLEELYASHAELNIETGLRQCDFILTAPKTGFNKLATKLLKGLFSPKLSEVGLDHARRLTFDDQRLGGGLSNLITLVAGETLLTEVSSGGGDYRNPALGDKASVVELRLRDLKRHAEQFFVPANATIAAAGPIDKKLKRALKALRGGERNEVKRGDIAGLPRELEHWAPREMHLHAQVLDLATPKDVAVARVLESLVYDRFMWRLRYQGVTYGPSVMVMPFDWLDLLVIFVPVSNSRERGIRVEPLLRQYLDQLLVDVPEDEYRAARDHVVGAMLQADTKPPVLAGQLMRRNRRVSWHDDEVLAAVKGLSKQDFLSAIRQWLGPERSINFLFGRGRAKYKAKERR